MHYLTYYGNILVRIFLLYIEERRNNCERISTLPRRNRIESDWLHF